MLVVVVLVVGQLDHSDQNISKNGGGFEVRCLGHDKFGLNGTFHLWPPEGQAQLAPLRTNVIQGLIRQFKRIILVALLCF